MSSLVPIALAQAGRSGPPEGVVPADAQPRVRLPLVEPIGGRHVDLLAEMAALSSWQAGHLRATLGELRISRDPWLQAEIARLEDFQTEHPCALGSSDNPHIAADLVELCERAFQVNASLEIRERDFIEAIRQIMDASQLRAFLAWERWIQRQRAADCHLPRGPGAQFDLRQNLAEIRKARGDAQPWQNVEEIEATIECHEIAWTRVLHAWRDAWSNHVRKATVAGAAFAVEREGHLLADRAEEAERVREQWIAMLRSFDGEIGRCARDARLQTKTGINALCALLTPEVGTELRDRFDQAAYPDLVRLGCDAPWDTATEAALANLPEIEGAEALLEAGALREEIDAMHAQLRELRDQWYDHVLSMSGYLHVEYDAYVTSMRTRVGRSLNAAEQLKHLVDRIDPSLPSESRLRWAEYGARITSIRRRLEGPPSNEWPGPYDGWSALRRGYP